jgi:hypothetical protein
VKELRSGLDHYASLLSGANRERVCDRYVGANAFPLVAALFWLYILQPEQKLLVTGVLVVHAAPEQHVWKHRHNQTGII